MDGRHLRARPGHRRRRAGSTNGARTTSTITTASTSRSCSTCSWTGQPRKVLVRPDRNGYLYVIDRTTGEVLSAEPFGARQLDQGRRSQDRAADRRIRTRSPVQARSCAISARPRRAPRTGSPLRSRRGPGSSTSRTTISAWTSKASRRTTSPARPMSAPNVRMIAGPGGHRGEFTAWDVAKAAPAWTIKENFPVWSGAVATAGDVVFYGTMEGWFKAVNARTGELLWQFKTASGIIGQPITYRGPDGQQYVAILSGVGGWAGAIVSGDLDPRDGTAALGFVNAMADLKNVTTQGRHALCVPRCRSAAARFSRLLLLALLAASPGRRSTRAAGLRRSQQPAVLQRAARRLREPDRRRCSPHDLGATVSYTWWAQRRGFMRNTLKPDVCDLVPGVPRAPTCCARRAPYYRSSYVFVTRAGRARHQPHSTIRGCATADRRAADRRRWRQHAAGPCAGQSRHRRQRCGAIPSIGDYASRNPPARIVERSRAGEIDVAVVWGPLAGYFAARQPIALRIAPVSPHVDAVLPMIFEIAMGVRRGDEALAREIDAAWRDSGAAIDAILAEYGVPRSTIAPERRGNDAHGGAALAVCSPRSCSRPASARSAIPAPNARRRANDAERVARRPPCSRAGGRRARTGTEQRSEYEENAFHVSEGKRLYTGSTAAAATPMAAAASGPALMDDKWIYGSGARTSSPPSARAGRTACRRSAASSRRADLADSRPMCARWRPSLVEDVRPAATTT